MASPPDVPPRSPLAGVPPPPPAGVPALAGPAPRLPALAGSPQLRAAVRGAAVPPAASASGALDAAELWLLRLRQEEAVATLGKAASYRWLAVAVGILLGPKTTSLRAKYATETLEAAFLSALATTASKLEGGDAADAVSFRRRVIARVRDHVAFKEASLRLVHCFVPATSYVDSECAP
ncbi:MAG: hypothetical protein GY772_31605 [bacterium]|nr:hypothetical protein [bacterium]